MPSWPPRGEALQLITARPDDDFARWLDSLPEEDEEISQQEEATVREAHDEIKREFGHHST